MAWLVMVYWKQSITIRKALTAGRTTDKSRRVTRMMSMSTKTGPYAEIENTVLETGVQIDLAELSILTLKVGFGTRGILKVEGETTLSLAGDKQLVDGDLSVLNSAALDRLQGLGNGTLNEDNGLGGDVLGKLHHLLADSGLVKDNQSLDSGAALAKLEKAHLVT
jgi:hypothetical protein